MVKTMERKREQKAAVVSPWREIIGSAVSYANLLPSQEAKDGAAAALRKTVSEAKRHKLVSVADERELFAIVSLLAVTR